MVGTWEVGSTVESARGQREFPLAESFGVECFGADGDLRTLREIECDVIRLAMNVYDGRLCQIARLLRISRSTLYRKLDEYGIPQPPRNR